MTGAKMYGALALTVVVTLLIVFGTNHYMGLRDKASLADSRGTTLQSASAITAAGTQADAEARADEATVSSARDQFNQSTMEAERANPDLAARAATPVPDSVRDSFRARRLARERLGRDGREREPGAGPEDPPER